MSYWCTCGHSNAQAGRLELLDVAQARTRTQVLLCVSALSHTHRGQSMRMLHACSHMHTHPAAAEASRGVPPTVTYASAYTGSDSPVSCSTRLRRLASASAASTCPVARCRSARGVQQDVGARGMNGCERGWVPAGCGLMCACMRACICVNVHVASVCVNGCACVLWRSKTAWNAVCAVGYACEGKECLGHMVDLWHEMRCAGACQGGCMHGSWTWAHARSDSAQFT